MLHRSATMLTMSCCSGARKLLEFASDGAVAAVDHAVDDANGNSLGI